MGTPNRESEVTGVGKFFEAIVGVAFKKLEKATPGSYFYKCKIQKNTNAKMHNEIKYRNIKLMPRPI